MDNSGTQQENRAALEEMHPTAYWNHDHIIMFVYDEDNVRAICRCGWHRHLGTLLPKSSLVMRVVARFAAKHFQDAEV